MIEYWVLLTPFVQTVITAHDNETVEEAFRRQYPYRYYRYKIHKVIAKRDTKGNGVWEAIK